MFVSNLSPFMHPVTKARWQMHFCVLLWGFTAVFGKLMTLSALPLVWWRMLLVTTALWLTPRVRRNIKTLSPRRRWAYAGIGVLVSLHWLTFYAAIKLANASVAATCLALGPVFMALVEPWIAPRRFNPRELLIGVLVVPGVVLVVGGVPTHMHVGIAVGVLSVLLVTLFGSLNKRLAGHGDPFAVTCIELGAGALCLTLLAPLLPHTGPAFVLPGPRDAVLLALLSFACTWLPFALALTALRHMSAFEMQMVTNLEPIYSILLAIPLLGEQRELDGRFYLGVVIILTAVFMHALLNRQQRHTGQPKPITTDKSRDTVA